MVFSSVKHDIYIIHIHIYISKQLIMPSLINLLLMYHDLLVNHDTSTLIMIFITIADDIINVILVCLLLLKCTVNITV